MFDPIVPSMLAHVPVETHEVTMVCETKGGGRGERGGWVDATVTINGAIVAVGREGRRDRQQQHQGA